MVKIRKGTSSRVFVFNARYIFDPTIDTLVVNGDNVVYLGREDRLKSYKPSSSDTVIDAEGLYLSPGFIDSHIHIWSSALSRKVIDLRNVNSIEEIKAKIRNARDVGGIIIGRGWDQDRFPEKRMPTRYDLDDVVSDKPVVLVRVCGHVAVVNTKAMEIFKLIDNPKIEKYLLRDEEGRVNGVIVEDAVAYVMKKINEALEPGNIGVLEELLIDLASKGITSAGMMSASRREIELVSNLYTHRRYVRLYAYISRDELSYLDKINSYEIVDKFLRIEGIKIFSDGSLGGRTAYLHKEYNDDPGNRGLKLLSEKEFIDLMDIARKTDLQIAVHCIGDAALDFVLDTALRHNFIGVSKLRIEHASVLSDSSIDLFKKVKPGISIQPRFTVSDFWIESRLGRERISKIYMFKTLIDLGMCVSCSSDSPVEPYDPVETIRSAMFRGPGGINLSETLSFIDVLKLYTKGGGCILRKPNIIGCIDQNCIGDFILFDYRHQYSIDVKVTHIAGSGIFVSDKDIIEPQSL